MLNIGVRRDDGVVVYLNGAEVFSDNMPDEEIFYSTLARSSNISETALQTGTVRVDRLVPGTNVIAAEIHQASGTSSDISFALELTAIPAPPSTTDELPFTRGDATGDRFVDIVDPVLTLFHLFDGGGKIFCQDAADANDDGMLDASDAVVTLIRLFLNGQELPAPGANCGPDSTTDQLNCLFYSSCPEN
jgi:hypothetical protein